MFLILAKQSQSPEKFIGLRGSDNRDTLRTPSFKRLERQKIQNVNVRLSSCPAASLSIAVLSWVTSTTTAGFTKDGGACYKAYDSECQGGCQEKTDGSNQTLI